MDKWVIRTPSTSSDNKRTNTDEESQNSELNAPYKKIRKYNEEFIKYGFTICVVDDGERPICVISNANLKKFTTIPQKALRSSLEVSYLIGKTMKPHTIGESLIHPAATKMTSIMHGNKYGNELKQYHYQEIPCLGGFPKCHEISSQKS
ncbi:hypothetical protein TNCV_5116761 [Trichonephila clavipes]|nr:hypothetical protein TNCV_5116761 [Trichonephila clavipes]